jgi:DNA ligase-1
MPEFAMLAHVATNENCVNWYLSQKLNGWRCLYDGGITRGLRVYQVPWVKNTRYGAELSTGLWTLGRSSGPQPIFCPVNWTQDWPSIPFDGELWHKSDDISFVKSICGQGPKGIFDPRWSEITYQVFGYKPFCLWPASMETRVPNKFLFYNNVSWLERQRNLTGILDPQTVEHVHLLPQYKVRDLNDAIKCKETMFSSAEGVMLANPQAEYQLKRSSELLKVKDFFDIEVEIIGHAEGAGKHQDRLGALRCRVKWDSKVTSFYGGTAKMVDTIACFNVGGGFSDSQREWPWVNANLPIGKTIKVKFLSVSKDGIPCSVQYEGEDHAP